MIIRNKFLKSKYFPIILFIIYFFVPFILYRHLLANDQLFINADGIQFFSMKLFIKECLQNGQLPLWNPYLENGIPYAGDLSGLFYPPNVLLSFLPTKLFVYSYYSFHIALGAIFMYLYLKEIECNRFSALCTSIIYLVSVHIGGYRKSHMALITTIVLFPVILFFAERYIKTRKIKYLIFSAFVMALQFYTGNIQYVIYTDLAVFVYLLFMGIRSKFPVKKMLKDGFAWGLTYLGMTAVQLIPVAQLLSFYQKSGSGQTSYDTFIGWSIHPIKLLMMLFPYVFGDIYEPFGYRNSNEIDIEIFLGVGVFIFILFAVFSYWKEYRVKVSMTLMAVAFIYCAQAHIPVLSRLLFKIPVINGFRCSSRALFIFIFFAYVLFAISLSKLEKRQNFDQMNRFVKRFAVVTIAGSGIIGFVLLAVCVMQDNDYKTASHYFNLAFLPSVFAAVIVVAIFLIAGMFIRKYGEGRYNIVYISIALAMTVLVVSETIPFSTLYDTTPGNPINIDNAEQEIKENIGYHKVLLAFNSIDGSYNSMIAYNSNIPAKIPAINAYIAFNNPRLFRLFTNEKILKPTYNFSGMMTGFLDIKNNLRLQNDLISMLGVKYILDPLNLITEDGSIYNLSGEAGEVFKTDSVSIAKQDNKDITVWLCQEVPLEPNQVYKIVFNMTSKADSDNILYFDFYGGPGYDTGEQENHIIVSAGTKSEIFYLNSGDCTTAQDGKTFVRIFGIPDTNIQITNFRLTKMNTIDEKNVYKLFTTDEATNTKIYENINAKDILYTSQYLKGIESAESIYDNVLDYDLDDTSYIENYKDKDISGVITDINVLDYNNNGIKAKVEASGDTFMNFSQNYYPGWKAYIDGKKTPLYMVNGLIQGIEVPQGSHVIAFRFVPYSLYIGAIITALTFILSIILFIRKKKEA